MAEKEKDETRLRCEFRIRISSFLSCFHNYLKILIKAPWLSMAPIVWSFSYAAGALYSESGNLFDELEFFWILEVVIFLKEQIS